MRSHQSIFRMRRVSMEFQPDSVMIAAKILGTAIGTFFGICFFIGVLNGSTEIKPLAIPDNFDIGYISDRHSVKQFKSNTEEINILRNKVQKLKLKRQLAEELELKRSKKTRSKHALFDECVSTLISLGENKARATQITTEFLEKSPNVKTIDEFITGVFKK